MGGCFEAFYQYSAPALRLCLFQEWGNNIFQDLLDLPCGYSIAQNRINWKSGVFEKALRKTKDQFDTNHLRAAARDFTECPKL
ncbi:hypothetical protein Y032_0071g545 [Ancylostoma ceylanicum]|uniref:Uncharacterized protein n=1 Tax=Ancylostoma ceylanicum TaxID=53326 RepID=A0A016TWQ9_9BILA|nr:hypothetical protein Y032_0071g545 [Ancylostoma ceylanicum]